MKCSILSILTILILTACSHQVQPVATQTVVEKEKIPKSAIEPWFNSNIESSDKTAGGALDLILRLRGELQKAENQLKHVVEVQQVQTDEAIEGINSLKSKGGEYEMLNTKYPDDPAINCVFKPSSAGCNQDGSRKGEATKVSN